MKKARKGLVVFFIAAVAFGTAGPAFASDWDKAGIALTGIEGLRVITGGKVDLVGSVFGLNRDSGSHRKYSGHQKAQKRSHRYARPKRNYNCHARIWVPHYQWTKKYIPKHEEHDKRLGKVIVEGHYIKYQVSRGGHWEAKDYCG